MDEDKIDKAIHVIKKGMAIWDACQRLKAALDTTADSAGFVIGRVFNRGAPASNCEVYIWDVLLGDVTPLQITTLGKVEKNNNAYIVRTDHEGYFCFAFTWGGYQIGSDVSSVTAQTAVFWEGGTPVVRSAPNRRLLIKPIVDLSSLGSMIDDRSVISVIGNLIESQKRIQLVGYRCFDIGFGTYRP
ncbi:hypothetical protein P1X15_22965 [Runella sp. MFBS21]|uniref:hypothetical protein n=1 Tax=Runella sp. MFBS21 TaxID=3034018 RepID=UPI0023F92341|nr:hypothetical protein [Runella sp. MFBS21]MDF7820503.1 hypothetical protein [Runella sp. MFBS21]